MSGPRRLPSGGRIARDRTLSFSWNGKRYQGHPGDTLASALLANGVSFCARSMKYHRPRGIVSAGPEEPNALVQLGRGASAEPNARATVTELFDGLTAAPVNCWPSLDTDVGAVNGWMSRLFVAGFYYKTFMWPKALWQRLYEPIIRRAAGFGTAPKEPDADTYDRMNVHCDVLVVGAGPAGLAAALAAGRSGARVILVDEQPEPGGSLLFERTRIDGKPGADWAAEVVAELAAMDEVQILTRTTAFGYYDQNYLTLLERRTDHLAPAQRPAGSRQRVWHVRATRVILATGMHERPLVFANNDRPGIMLAGAVRAYARRYGVAAGSQAVVFANNDSGYETALVLHQAGVVVQAVVDSRSHGQISGIDNVRAAGIEVIPGAVITETLGKRRVEGCVVRSLSADGQRLSGPERELTCDLIAVSGGFSPVVHLFSHAGGKLRFDDTLAAFVPDRVEQDLVCIGGLAGQRATARCLAQGIEAGSDAAMLAGFTAPVPPLPKVEEPDPGQIVPLWMVPSDDGDDGGYAKHFVDFQNDTSAADIRLATREGFTSVEHMKRFTLSGFGTDQGKTGNINALSILADATGRTQQQTGTTTFRPPYTPVTLGALAGRDVGAFADPIRRTAMHAWHEANGAAFEAVGQWKRPWFYPRPGEGMEAAVRRECIAVRKGVGIIDASTLGKIDVVGPDAGELLNRLYTNAFKKLPVGSVRYGLMCREDGMVFDDGTVTRLAEDHFFVTTTTGGAAGVLDWMEDWLQTEWTDLKVYLTSTTEQWAVASIAGPRARDLLAKLVDDVDLSADAFPFMTMREGTVAGLKARLFRVSFTGELSFEINVPWRQGTDLWQALMAAGEEFGITPYGTETMHVLRAEKGFIIVGQETDGTMTPHDLGMSWAVSKTKDFLGKRSLARSDTAKAYRKQLVGLLPDDGAVVLPEGTQLIENSDLGMPPPVPMHGHVTSSYFSPTLGRSFALAVLKGGQSRIGSSVTAALAGKPLRCQVVDPVFYDKDGSRRDG